MKRLGRARGSVIQKLYQLRDVRQPHYQGIKPIVRKLVSIGQEDARIALKIGRSKRTIRHYRRSMGLKANKSSPWRQTNEPHTRKRCMGCNLLCPIAVTSKWTQLTGWSSKRIHSNGGTITLILCSKCTKEINEVTSNNTSTKASCSSTDNRKVYSMS